LRAESEIPDRKRRNSIILHGRCADPARRAAATAQDLRPGNDKAQQIQYDGLEGRLQATIYGKEQLMKKLFLVMAAAATLIAGGLAQNGPGNGRSPMQNGPAAQNCPNPNCPRRANCPNRDNCPNPNCPRRTQKPPAAPAK
jgi:hypothetical protein